MITELSSRNVLMSQFNVDALYVRCVNKYYLNIKGHK